jgi:hypothetical protein
MPRFWIRRETAQELFNLAGFPAGAGRFNFHVENLTTGNPDEHGFFIARISRPENSLTV